MKSFNSSLKSQVTNYSRLDTFSNLLFSKPTETLFSLPKLNSLKFVPRRNFVGISIYFFFFLRFLVFVSEYSLLCSHVTSKKFAAFWGSLPCFCAVRYRCSLEACCLYMWDSEEYSSILFQMISVYPASRRHIPKNKGRLYLGDLVSSFSQ